MALRLGAACVAAALSTLPTLALAQGQPAPVAGTATVYVQAPPPGYVYAQPAPAYYYGRPPPVARWRTRTVAYTGGPIPPGAVLSSRANIGLIVAGSSALGAGYFAALLGWSLTIQCAPARVFATCSSASPWLLVPLVGPWAALTDARHSPAGNALIIADGVVQAAGLALLIAGFAVRSPVLVYRYLGRDGAPRSTPLRAALTPWSGAGAAGLSLAGAF